MRDRTDRGQVPWIAMMRGERLPGQVLPVVMNDALHAGEQSVLDNAKMKLRDLPDNVFTKGYLKELE